MSNSHRRPMLPFILAATGLAIAGCQSTTVTRGLDRSNPHGRAIVMDGRFDDWPQNTASLADEHFLYFRVTVEDHGMPLQSAPETVALWLDLDHSADTGHRLDDLPDLDMGVDLIIEFSPPGQRPGQLRRGVAVHTVDGDGNRTPLSHAQIDLLAAPTHAAGAYEIRIARNIEGEAPESLRNALAARGSARSMFVISTADGEIDGWSDPERFSMPAAAGRPARVDVSLPSRPEGAVRILSFNALNNAPLSTPAPFARIIQSLEPDVVLFQEMWDTDEATLLAWFTSVVTGDVDWAVRTPPDGQGGVAIISRYPLTPLGADLLTLPAESAANDRRSPRHVRFIAANIDSPYGEVAVANIHLKCCGTAGSSEDQRRLAEARAINLDLRSALEGSSVQMRIIAGDYNLVGSREPLDILRAGLDADGNSLHPISTMVLGDAAIYTWFNPESAFPPGRLDWVVAGTSGAQVVNAFVVDARRLTDAALVNSGLDRGDTAISDHFPMVLDIRPAD